MDLGWQQREIEAEVRDGIEAVLADTAFVMGPQVAEFEAAYAAFFRAMLAEGVAMAPGAYATR